MQQISGLARRYGLALFKVAGSDTVKARKALQDLACIKELYAIEMAAKVLKSPVMPMDLKMNLLKYALKDSGAEASVKQFVLSVAEAGRLAELPLVLEAVEQLLDSKEGKAKADVYSVVALSSEQMNSVSEAIGGGKKVELKNKIDKSILGGLVVKMGNKVVDLSLRSQIQSLAKTAMS